MASFRASSRPPPEASVSPWPGKPGFRPPKAAEIDLPPECTMRAYSILDLSPSGARTKI